MYNGATEQVMGKKLSPKSLNLPLVVRYCVVRYVLLGSTLLYTFLCFCRKL